MELPVGAGPLKPMLPRAPERVATADAGAGAAVLVVEDEAALGAAVAEALADAGFSRGSRQRRDRGARAAAGAPLRPDRLRSEDAAPRRRRRSIASWNRSIRRWRARVLFVTGDVAGTDAERFLEETGCRWLAKPFRLKDLLRVAREMLE